MSSEHCNLPLIEVEILNILWNLSMDTPVQLFLILHSKFVHFLLLILSTNHGMEENLELVTASFGILRNLSSVSEYHGKLFLSSKVSIVSLSLQYLLYYHPLSFSEDSSPDSSNEGDITIHILMLLYNIADGDRGSIEHRIAPYCLELSEVLCLYCEACAKLISTSVLAVQILDVILSLWTAIVPTAHSLGCFDSCHAKWIPVLFDVLLQISSLSNDRKLQSMWLKSLRLLISLPSLSSHLPELWYILFSNRLRREIFEMQHRLLAFVMEDIVTGDNNQNSFGIQEWKRQWFLRLFADDAHCSALILWLISTICLSTAEKNHDLIEIQDIYIVSLRLYNTIVEYTTKQFETEHINKKVFSRLVLFCHVRAQCCVAICRSMHHELSTVSYSQSFDSLLSTESSLLRIFLIHFSERCNKLHWTNRDDIETVESLLDVLKLMNCWFQLQYAVNDCIQLMQLVPNFVSNVTVCLFTNANWVCEEPSPLLFSFLHELCLLWLQLIQFPAMQNLLHCALSTSLPSVFCFEWIEHSCFCVVETNVNSIEQQKRVILQRELRIASLMHCIVAVKNQLRDPLVWAHRTDWTSICDSPLFVQSLMSALNDAIVDEFVEEDNISDEMNTAVVVRPSQVLAVAANHSQLSTESFGPQKCSQLHLTILLNICRSLFSGKEECLQSFPPFSLPVVENEDSASWRTKMHPLHRWWLMLGGVPALRRLLTQVLHRIQSTAGGHNSKYQNQQWEDKFDYSQLYMVLQILLQIMRVWNFSHNELKSMVSAAFLPESSCLRVSFTILLNVLSGKEAIALVCELKLILHTLLQWLHSMFESEESNPKKNSAVEKIAEKVEEDSSNDEECPLQSLSSLPSSTTASFVSYGEWSWRDDASSNEHPQTPIISDAALFEVDFTGWEDVSVSTRAVCTAS
jgi:hypothetical protein